MSSAPLQTKVDVLLGSKKGVLFNCYQLKFAGIDCSTKIMSDIPTRQLTKMAATAELS